MARGVPPIALVVQLAAPGLGRPIVEDPGSRPSEIFVGPWRFSRPGGPSSGCASPRAFQGCPNRPDRPPEARVMAREPLGGSTIKARGPRVGARNFRASSVIFSVSGGLREPGRRGPGPLAPRLGPQAPGLVQPRLTAANLIIEMFCTPSSASLLPCLL